MSAPFSRRLFRPNQRCANISGQTYLIGWISTHIGGVDNRYARVTIWLALRSTTAPSNDLYKLLDALYQSEVSFTVFRVRWFFALVEVTLPLIHYLKVLVQAIFTEAAFTHTSVRDRENLCTSRYRRQGCRKSLCLFATTYNCLPNNRAYSNSFPKRNARKDKRN